MKKIDYNYLATEIYGMSPEEASKVNIYALHYAYITNIYNSKEDGLSLIDPEGFKAAYDEVKDLNKFKINALVLTGSDKIAFIRSCKCFEDEKIANAIFSEISDYSKKGEPALRVLEYYGNCENESQVKANKAFLAANGGDIEKAISILTSQKNDRKRTFSEASSATFGDKGSRSRSGSDISIEF